MAASKNLSKKEIEILSILAHAENPMTISDIVATNSAYTTNIVQPIIHKLSDLGLVEVSAKSPSPEHFALPIIPKMS